MRIENGGFCRHLLQLLGRGHVGQSSPFGFGSVHRVLSLTKVSTQLFAMFKSSVFWFSLEFFSLESAMFLRKALLSTFRTAPGAKLSGKQLDASDLLSANSRMMMAVWL